MIAPTRKFIGAGACTVGPRRFYSSLLKKEVLVLKKENVIYILWYKSFFSRGVASQVYESNFIDLHEESHSDYHVPLKYHKAELKEKDYEIARLNSLLGAKDNQLALKDEEIRKLNPMLVIRRKIEIYESLIAPELRDPRSVFRHSSLKSSSDHMEFHEAKWKIILRKETEDVIQLKNLLCEAKIAENLFCRRMGGFFLLASGDIHLAYQVSVRTRPMK